MIRIEEAVDHRDAIAEDIDEHCRQELSAVAVTVFDQPIVDKSIVDHGGKVENRHLGHAALAVPGVDVVHVGSNDLLTAMGIPGAYGTPEHLAALDKVFAACNKHGKVAGVGGDRNVARQVEFIRKGARFLTTNSDIAFILAEGSRVTGELRKALNAPDVKQKIATQGAEPAPDTPQQLAVVVRDEYAKWKRLTDQANIHAQ